MALRCLGRWICCVTLISAGAEAQGVREEWPQHSLDRPRPPAVNVRGAVTTPPPADAIVLFDGTGLARWVSGDSAAATARWKVENGYVEVVRGTGGIATRDSFADVQLHVEFMSPAAATGEGQNRGNSGVFLMGRYEVQVLDSWRNDTYPDGQAGSLYGQFPPLVNASLPPGEWQSYDIVFIAPRFDASGKLVSPARLTVLHNGVVVQHDRELLGPTSHRTRAPYEAHPARLPISLQDHGDPVRFRNIWVRNLR